MAHCSLPRLMALMLATAVLPSEGAGGSSFFKPDKPITLKHSGGFATGGTVIHNPANETQQLSCDHGYMEYFLPWTPRKTSLVMWHSSSAQVWQNRWDGGPGFKDMFLQRDYPVFLWDGPRVGRANWPCVETTYTPGYRDPDNFAGWRFGPLWKEYFDDTQFPQGAAEPEALNQAMRARYDETDTFANVDLQSDAAAVALDSGRLGDSVVYLTNSAAGYRAQVTVTKSSGGKGAGIVAYESIGFVYPTDIDPSYNITENRVGGFGPLLVPPQDFAKLAELDLVQFVWGSHVHEVGNWDLFIGLSRICAAEINRYGGNAEVLLLEDDLGLKGQTHIMFADMDNDKIAALLEKALKKNKLDKYEKKGWQRIFPW